MRTSLTKLLFLLLFPAMAFGALPTKPVELHHGFYTGTKQVRKNILK